MEKIKKKVPIVNWSSYELDGKLTDIISKLQSLITDNPNYFDFEIEVETESGYYSSCSTNIKVDAFRWETEEELEERKTAFQKRAEAAKLAAKNKAEANEKRERTLYESLKKKFESEINETNPKNPIVNG